MKRKGLLLLLGFLCGVWALGAPDPNFHIYLCFGQSNMEGQGTIESQDQTCNERFQKLVTVNNSYCMSASKGEWCTATPPIVTCDGKLSPLDYFGRTLVDSLPSEIKVGVVAVAVAGCDIQLFEKNNYSSYVSSAASWMQSRITNYGGNPYGRLIEMAKIAQEKGVIKGILLHQGESNSGQSNWPSRVKAIYENIISDLGLNADEVPLLAGQVHSSGSCNGMNSIINQLPNQRSNFYVISSQGITGMLQDGQNVHFDAAGYRTLGKRYAEKMLQLLDRTVQPGGDDSEETGEVEEPIQETPDYYFKGDDLKIEAEEMPTVDGKYCKAYNELFSGMAYYANNDLTAAKVNFSEGGTIYFTLMGCADATTDASVTLSVGNEKNTYTWNANEATAITKSFAIPDSGTYNVQILMETDQGQSDAFVDYLLISANESTSYSEVNKPTFSIFPNPMEETLMVAGADIKQIEFIDLNGIVCLSANQSVVDVNTLPKGAYVVRLTGIDGTISYFSVMKK